MPQPLRTRIGHGVSSLSAVADTVRYEVNEHVATITYHRPDKLNAIDQQMRAELNTAFAAFRDDENAWVAIVTGAGRAFCSGADIHSPGNPAGEFPGTYWERPTVNSFESGWEIYKPVIAAVNGYCLGYGLTLVTWCDFVIASEHAVFGYPEVRIGTPTIVGAIRLPQRIGWQHAMELLLTGEQIDAERAKEIGLAGWVVPHSALLPTAQELADRLLAAAPLAARATKEVARRSPDMSAVDAVRFGETMRLVTNITQDAAEGRTAALERRPPIWRGR
jgi:E-phenylitaconyl-CoA hydratase